MQKRRLFVPLIFAGMAAAAGVASANPTYWRDNGLMLEVSADPRDGTDLVHVDSTRATQLELRALNDVVTLRGITLHFADGRAMQHPMSLLRPGQPLFVDLPHHCAAITSVELDYGDSAYRRYDRTTARLQIVPHMTRGYDEHIGYHYPAYTQPYTQPTYTQPTYTQPTYTQPYTQPTYTQPSSSYYVAPPVRQSRYTVVRPRRTHSSWQIQGTVRF